MALSFSVHERNEFIRFSASNGLALYYADVFDSRQRKETLEFKRNDHGCQSELEYYSVLTTIFILYVSVKVSSEKNSLICLSTIIFIILFTTHENTILICTNQNKI